MIFYPVYTICFFTFFNSSTFFCLLKKINLMEYIVGNLSLIQLKLKKTTSNVYFYDINGAARIRNDISGWKLCVARNFIFKLHKTCQEINIINIILIMFNNKFPNQFSVYRILFQMWVVMVILYAQKLVWNIDN